MDKNEVLQQLAEEWNQEAVREDELTVIETSRFLKDAGMEMSTSYVGRKMKKLVDDGVLKSRTAKRNGVGGTIHAYSPVEGKTWEDVLQYIKKK